LNTVLYPPIKAFSSDQLYELLTEAAKKIEVEMSSIMSGNTNATPAQVQPSTTNVADTSNTQVVQS